jgi:hypothetical protein
MKYIMKKRILLTAAFIAAMLPALASADSGSYQSQWSNDNSGNNSYYQQGYGSSYNNNQYGQQNGTSSLMLMKHFCPATISKQDFESMSFAQKEAACPTVVMPGDTPTPGAISGGQKDFSFSLNSNSNWNGNSNMSGMFMQEKVCEDKLGLDANKDGQISSSTCLDASHYDYSGIGGSNITVTEDTPDNSSIVDVVATTPSLAIINAVQSFTNNSIVVNAQNNQGVMLHIFNMAQDNNNDQGNYQNQGNNYNNQNWGDKNWGNDNSSWNKNDDQNNQWQKDDQSSWGGWGNKDEDNNSDWNDNSNDNSSWSSGHNWSDDKSGNRHDDWSNKDDSSSGWSDDSDSGDEWDD